MSSRRANGIGNTMDNNSQQVEEDEMDFGSEHYDNDQVERNSRKRARGPTCMPKIWAQEPGQRILVSFNEYGQPIDKKTTSQLTHFMGSLARSGKFCPVDKSWHKVEIEKKKILLEFLEKKFDLPPNSEDWILASFGKKVRNWRARLKNDCYDSSMPLQEQINSKPKRVQEDQWKELVTSWNKEESKILSEKNKANRQKKKMVQVTGKKSYARIREELKDSLGRDPSRMEMFCACFSNDGNEKNMEATNAIKLMEELNSQLPEGYVDNPSPGDIFSKVIGEDKHGEARMFGLGVRGSDVWGLVPSRPSRRENMNWKSAYERVSGEVAELKAMFLKMHETSGDTLNDSSVPVRLPNSRVVASQPLALRVGVVVYLKSILNSTEIVAKGRIKSLNPEELVGGEEIGPNWCEVNVLTAVKRTERVVRPYDLIVTLQDAIGATVAWPCPFISVVPMEDA